jgi:PAS domain S-box-containing protein
VAEVGGAAIINAGTYRKITLLLNQIEEHERFLGNIIDCIGAQLLVFDRRLRVVVANRAFLTAHGLTEAEALGMSYGQLCQVNGDESCCPVDNVLVSGKMTRAVQERREADGLRWFERTATPLPNAAGEVEYVIEIIHDITAERRLKSAEAERVKLEGVIELAGTVAHEINTPLFAALGTAQLLQEDAGEAGSEALDLIVRNLKAIGELTAKMAGMTGYRSRDYDGATRIIELE